MMMMIMNYYTSMEMCSNVMLQEKYYDKDWSNEKRIHIR